MDEPTESSISEMNRRFNNRLKKLVSVKRSNTQFFTSFTYAQTIEKVKSAKCKDTKKKPEDYNRLRKFDVMSIDQTEKLIVPATNGMDVIRCYVHDGEIFYILHDIHLSIGHGGRTRMQNELNRRYKNITREMIVSYLKLCENCQKKRRVSKTDLIIESCETSANGGNNGLKLLNASQLNCRTCLKPSDLVSLTEVELINLIKQFISFKNLTFDEPNIPVCQACKTTLYNFFHFKQRIEEVDRLFFSCETKKIKLHEFNSFKSTVVETFASNGDDIFTTNVDESINPVKKSSMETGKDTKEILIKQEPSDGLCTKTESIYELDANENCEDKKERISDKFHPFNCVICTKSYTVLHGLVKHVKTMHPDVASVDCDRCAEKFLVQAQLDKHIARVHDYNKCSHCGKIFKSRKNMKDHAYNVHRVHVSQFNCAECECSFKSAASYKMHMKYHNGEMSRTMCNICGKHYRNIKIHVDSVHRKGEITYKCRTCNATHMDIVSFRKHTQTHKANVLKNEPHYRYTCTECPRKYTTKLHLKRHTQITHENTQRFHCVTCKKHYKQKKDYVVHMRRHTGERPFECDRCKMTFTNWDTLKAHIRTHTGEQPYECPVCHERFMHYNSLKRHRKKHTDVKIS